MAEKGFEPLTSQLGIPGTSYRIQLGLINEKWASRLLKGQNVIDSYIYKDEDIAEGGFPNQNLIVGWVLRTVAIPNINPHQVMKTTQALVKQAIEKKEQKKIMAPLEETKKIELEKVPDNEIKRPQSVGWVKHEEMKSLQELEEEKRQAFKERMIYKKQEEAAKRSGTITTSRELPSIPKGEQTQSTFCPHCGKDLDWKYCPFCGGKLPH
ncbi:MAG: zinc ribbon domain-containing protein [Candidatus Odinarchaeota archaeon]